MKPTVGSLVHYVAPGSRDGTYEPAHRHAVITEVHTEFNVSLAVINPTGIHFAQEVTYSEQAGPYSWHWPERAAEEEGDNRTEAELVADAESRETKGDSFLEDMKARLSNVAPHTKASNAEHQLAYVQAAALVDIAESLRILSENYS